MCKMSVKTIIKINVRLYSLSLGMMNGNDTVLHKKFF